VTAPYSRAAATALDEARPAMGRLDLARDAEDVAADLIEAWDAAQRALRGLTVGASALSGQALIRQLRTRDLLTLDQGHALIEFAAAAERAQQTDYQPGHADVEAARMGFQQLEAAVLRGPSPAAEKPRLSGPISGPAAPPNAAGAPTPAAFVAPDVATPGDPTRFVFLGLLVLVLLVAIGGAGYVLYRREAPKRAMQRAEAAYRAGDRTTARALFAEIARDAPDQTLPHVYLGRLAREEGDAATASRELAAAIQLDPSNALAQREMGAQLLSTATTQLNQGNVPAALQTLDLAAKFYTRASSLDPTDRTAQGFLGCTLIRLGALRNVPTQMELGLRFTRRAGQGDWSACERLAVPPVAPAGVPR
jgi:tetratricopeptide (TPR) repeat protein